MDILTRVESKPDLDSCALVCRKWNRIDRLTRRKVKIAAYGAADQLLARVIGRFTGLTSVIIDELVPLSSYFPPGLGTPSKHRVILFFFVLGYIILLRSCIIEEFWWRCTQLRIGMECT